MFSNTQKKLFADADWYSGEPFVLLGFKIYEHRKYFTTVIEIRVARFVAGVYIGEL